MSTQTTHVDVQTPLIRLDGTSVVVTVSEADDGFKLSGYAGPGSSGADGLCGTLGLAVDGDRVTCDVVDEAELPSGIFRVGAGGCLYLGADGGR